MRYKAVLRLVEGNKKLARQVVAFLKRRDKLTASEWRTKLKPLMTDLAKEIDESIKNTDAPFWKLTNLKAIRGSLGASVAAFDQKFAIQLNQSQFDVMEMSMESVERQLKSVGLGIPSQLAFADDILETISPLTAAVVNNFTSDMAKIIQTEVSIGLTNGDSTFEVARRLRDKFKSSNMSLARAERIATTEMNTASALAQRIRGDEVERENPQVRKIWINSHKPNARVTHIAVERASSARPLRMNEFFNVAGESAQYPRDTTLSAKNRVNCFIPSTKVQGDFVGGLKVKYVGPVIEINTRSGSRLTVTPNHPVLTTSGLLAAHHLREGFNLIHNSGTIKDSSIPSPGHNYKNSPARIDEVFHSLRSKGRLVNRECMSDDLHGDGAWANGDIEIIKTNSLLPQNTIAMTLKHRIKSFFIFPAMSNIFKSCLSSLEFFLITMLSTLGSFVSRFDLFGYRNLAFTSDRFPLSLSIFRSTSNLDTGIGKGPGYDRSANIKILRQSLDRGSRFVSSDSIVEIREYEFSGHVYDLQSKTGLIVAENLYASNCGCTLVFVNEDELEDLGIVSDRVEEEGLT